MTRPILMQPLEVMPLGERRVLRCRMLDGTAADALHRPLQYRDDCRTTTIMFTGVSTAIAPDGVLAFTFEGDLEPGAAVPLEARIFGDLCEFWTMSSWGEPNGPQAPRAFGFWNLSEDVARSLCRGGAPADWPADAAIQLEPGSPPEDAIWAGTEAIPVSDRLRQWMEHEAPGQAVFLPIRVKGMEKPEALPTYWIMTPAAAIDCLDRRRTVASISRVIDETKVGAELGIFRAADDVQCAIFVRDRLRRAIESAGFSGLLFSPVQHTGLVRHRWKPRADRGS